MIQPNLEIQRVAVQPTTKEVFKSTDKGLPSSAFTIDYSKAFYLVDHTTLINKLVELEVRRKVYTGRYHMFNTPRYFLWTQVIHHFD